MTRQTKAAERSGNGPVTARIIQSDNLEFSDGVLDGVITEYEGLKALRRPAMGGTGFNTEQIELVWPNGDVEVVEGYYVGSELI